MPRGRPRKAPRLEAPSAHAAPTAVSAPVLVGGMVAFARPMPPPPFAAPRASSSGHPSVVAPYLSIAAPRASVSVATLLARPPRPSSGLQQDAAAHMTDQQIEEHFEQAALAMQLLTEREKAEEEARWAQRERDLGRSGGIASFFDAKDVKLSLLETGPLSELVQWLDAVDALWERCGPPVELVIPARPDGKFGLKVCTMGPSAPCLLVETSTDARLAAGDIVVQVQDESLLNAATWSLAPDGTYSSEALRVIREQVAACKPSGRLRVVMRRLLPGKGDASEYTHSMPMRPAWSVNEDVLTLRGAVVELLRMERKCKQWYHEPARYYMKALHAEIEALVRELEHNTTWGVVTAWLRARHELMLDGITSMPTRVGGIPGELNLFM